MNNLKRRAATFALTMILLLSLMPSGAWATARFKVGMPQILSLTTQGQNSLSHDLVVQQHQVTKSNDLETRIADKLQGYISETAAGSRLSTVYEITVGELGLGAQKWTAEDLGVTAVVADGTIAADAVDVLMSELSYDLHWIQLPLLWANPFDLFWFDKTVGINSSGFNVQAEYDEGISEYVLSVTGSISFYFAVSTDYSAGDYLLDANRLGPVQTARAKAEEIVSINAGLSDYEKLEAYLTEICAIVSYDYSAVNSGQSYGNPWQAVWAFDSDPNTNVVCEGYAKAFQYLCDQSSFAGNVSCVSVTGVMQGGTGEGAHMWNIVTMEDGKNYLVDVTNCDNGTLGAPKQLFLVGTSGSVDAGYSFSCEDGTVTYRYDEDTRSCYMDSVLLLNSSAYVYAPQTETYVENGVTYTLQNGRAFVSGYAGSAKSLTIPAAVRGCPVTEIGSSAFMKNTTLESITLPASVVKIQDGEYHGWSYYNPDTSVTTFVDEGTFTPFWQCTSLKTVIIPEDSKLSYIGEYAFWDCTALSSITLPTAIRTLALSAFDRCGSLTELALPEGLEVIAQSALTKTSLTTLALPSTLIAFDNANELFELEEITVAEGNTHFRSADGVLYERRGDGKWDLSYYPWAKQDTTYRIPDFIDDFYWGPQVLMGIDGGVDRYKPLPYLRTVDIGLHQVADPAHLEQEIVMDPANPYHCLVDGILYDKEMTTVLKIPRSVTGKVILPQGITAIGRCAGFLGQFSEIVIPDSVTDIAAFAFGENDKLTRIELPNSIVNLSDDIFYGDPVLKEVVLPENIKSLPLGTFCECTGLKSIQLPESLERIEDSAFLLCTSLESISIPVSVTEIAAYAFERCDNLLEVYYGGKASDWGIISIGDYNKPLLDAGIHYNYTDAAAPLTVSITADKNFVTPGETVFWNAAATGGFGKKEYSFWVYRNGEVFSSGAYSEWDSFGFILTEPDYYTVEVFVKDKKGTIVSKMSERVIVSTEEPLTIAAVSPIKARILVGEKITWMAEAMGGSGTPKYRFYVYKDGVPVIKDAYQSGNNYSYTPDEAGIYSVRVYAKDGAGTVVSLNGGEVTVAVPEPPALKRSVEDGKVVLSWNKVARATKYRVYRRENTGSWQSWEIIGQPTKNSWTDDTVSAGGQYQYRVKAYVGSTWTDYSNRKAAVMAPPKLTVASELGKVTLSWNEITGAVKYRVIRTVDGVTTKVKVCGTTYTDTNVEADKSYSYSVQAQFADGSYSVASETKSLYYPLGIAVKVSGSKANISWTPVAGATKYQMYRRPQVNGKYGDWELIYSAKGTSFVDAPGVGVWQYRVRAVVDEVKTGYSNRKRVTIG